MVRNQIYFLFLNTYACADFGIYKIRFTVHVHFEFGVVLRFLMNIFVKKGRKIE